MKDKEPIESELLADDEGHTCPRCKSRNIAFITPENCIGSAKLFQDPNTGKVQSESKVPDGQYYRFTCRDCKLSTKNNVNLMRAINEWNSLYDQHKNG